MVQVSKFDVEAMLAPIPGDSPVGSEIKAGIYADIETSILASDWEKVRVRCADLLKKETKDVVIATALAKSLAGLHGVEGIHDGLLLIEGLHSRYWPNMFPRNEPDDHPPTEIWLNKLDRFLEQVVQANTPLTTTFEGKSYLLWEWQNCDRVLRDTSAALRSGKLRESERQYAQRDKAEAERISAQRARAIAATNRNFYEGMLEGLEKCSQAAGGIAKLVDEKFKSAEIDTEEFPPPNFERLRAVLKECTRVAAGALEQKPPSAEIVAPAEEPVPGGEAEGRKAQGGQIGSRENAIQELRKIGAFFQQTEPHSPIGYLVLRAARWGELSLEDWLDEVVKEPAVLGKIRETLGIEPKAAVK